MIATIQDETIKILQYIGKKASIDELVSESLRHHKPNVKEEEQDEPSWKDWHLDRIYHQQIE